MTLSVAWYLGSCLRFFLFSLFLCRESFKIASQIFWFLVSAASFAVPIFFSARLTIYSREIPKCIVRVGVETGVITSVGIAAGVPEPHVVTGVGHHVGCPSNVRISSFHTFLWIRIQWSSYLAVKVIFFS